MAGKPAILSVRLLSHANSRGFTQMMRSTRKLEREVAKASATMDAFSRTSRKVGMITAAAAAATGAVGALGIGIAGVGLLAAPAIAPILLGIDGIKQAATAAQGPFNNLKATISGVFASELVPGFEALGRVMDRLSPALESVAYTLSDGFNAATAGIEANASAIADVVYGAQAFLVGIGPGLAQLAGGLLNLAVSASAYATQIGAGVGALLGSIGEAFTRLQASGSLDVIFANLGPILASVGAVLGNVLFLFGQLGAAIAPVLAPILNTLATVISQLTPPLTMVAQVAGQALLQALTALAPAIGPLVSALAGVLVAALPLVPVFAQIVAQLATSLVPMITALAPVITVVANILAAVLLPVVSTLGGMMQAHAPILGMIVAGLTAYAAVSKVLAIAQTIMIAKQIALNAAMYLNPVGLVVAAIAALVAGVIIAYNKVDWFRNGVNALGRGFMAVVNAVKKVIGIIAKLHFPPMPGWLKKMFDAPAELFTVPPESLNMTARIVPVHNLDLAATGPTFTGLGALAAAASGGSGGTTTINNIHVDGALDPHAVADQIRGLLDNTSRSRGATMAATMGGRR